ncbi:short chain dehydrogenase/reductase family oxidoreductase [Aspergillus flavus]|uniref:Short chain dehydrogenase/reductase family oxidoreductase n=1 Tax=Aspergillus flavus TaxID=5059 RepID=A0AB74C2E9_ASPFL|nr:short chain dehydrogenase/reductase family oxidoreductase [Aspergillus flavus]
MLVFGIDWVGAVAASAALGLLSYALSAITGDINKAQEAPTIICFSLSGVLLIFFVLWQSFQERRNKPTLIRNSLWKNIAFTCICVNVFMVWGAFNAFEQVMNFFFQNVQDLSGVETTIRFIPTPITGLLSAPTTGFVLHRLNPTWVYWRCAFVAICLNTIAADSLFTVSIILIAGVFPAETQGLAAGVFNTVSQIGTSFGLAIVALISNQVTDQESQIEDKGSPEALIVGYRANGLGEGYVRALVAEGVNVCIADLNEEKGKKLEAELKGTKYIQCNTTIWEDQARLFREAVSFSPTGKIHYVVANAGIHRPDEVFLYSGDDQEPQKPDLSTIDVNIQGTLYTAKLASHYFIKQNGQTPSPKQEDTCLVLIGSGAAFLDCPRAPQYCASKWAMRGIMHALRRTAFYYGSRVNIISPWYVKTNILSEDAFAHVSSLGVVFATVEDAGQCLLRILSDTSINGHSIFVSGRKWAAQGYLDLDLEDYAGSALIQEIQEDQMKSAPASLGLFV